MEGKEDGHRRHTDQRQWICWCPMTGSSYTIVRWGQQRIPHRHLAWRVWRSVLRGAGGGEASSIRVTWAAAQMRKASEAAEAELT